MDEPIETQLIKSYAGRLRYKLVLGKFPISRVIKNMLGFEIIIQFPNNIKLVCQIPPTSDVREGDLLSLYTEVLAHDQPSETPVQ